MSTLLDETDPRKLIIHLCEKFYQAGWISGTGGGISIRDGNDIYIAPSGVQKEYIKEEDMFVIDVKGNVLQKPDIQKGLKISECTPLFLHIFQKRNAGAVIHSHALEAMLVTLLSQNWEFCIEKLEMIKGIKIGSTLFNHQYNERIIVPIIENTNREMDLAYALEQALDKYPQTNAILVHRHGVYIWGKDWKMAKIHAECYHYLFSSFVEMKKLQIV